MPLQKFERSYIYQPSLAMLDVPNIMPGYRKFNQFFWGYGRGSDGTRPSA